MKDNIAFWAALVIANVWAASANPAAGYLAAAWSAFAVFILAYWVAATWKRRGE